MNQGGVAHTASSYGLGAVLRQKQQDGTVKPIAYASRSMTDTEQRYAQIEKEALALTWACERFQHYLVGAKFTIETDHKPLVPLLSTKSLDQVPIKVQRFRLRLIRFDFTVTHVPGKELHTADALSRASLRQVDNPLRKEVHTYVQLIVTELPASEEQLENIRKQQDSDPECSQLKELCTKGKLSYLGDDARNIEAIRDEPNIVNGILMRGQRMIIPTTIRELMLSKLHSVHQGVTKCKEPTNQSVWWPGIRKNIEEVAYRCLTCCKHRRQEHLIPSEFPKYPWQVVATDLFEKKGVDYLLVVDYYSRYVKVTKLPKNKTAETVVVCLKSIFARHGIPEKVISDNGPQYASEKFKEFAAAYGFEHTTPSSRYPQSNGAAERAVKTVKSMFKKNNDLALLILWPTTPKNGFSPTELLISRKVRTTLPMTEAQLLSSVPDRELVCKREEAAKERMKKDFDKRHQAVSLR